MIYITVSMFVIRFFESYNDIHFKVVKSKGRNKGGDKGIVHIAHYNRTRMQFRQ